MDKISKNLALAVLLTDRVLFPNERKTVFQGDVSNSPTTVLYVICNDTFYPGADAQALPYNQIINLYEYHMKDEINGSTMWCAIQRKMKPMQHIVEEMIEQGIWNSELEKLPDNELE